MTQLFHLFDNSKPGYGLHQGYWLDGAKISNTLDIAYRDPSWRQKDEITIPPHNDFAFKWWWSCNVIAIHAPAGQMVYIDMEHIPHVRADGTKDYTYLVALARTFRQRMPGTRLSFLLPDLPYNREDVKSAKIKIDPKMFGELPELIDEICIGVYLLGAATVDRDLGYIGEMRRIVRRAWPRLDIAFNTWGQYHDEWNKTPEKYTIPNEVLKVYAREVTRHGDNVLVYRPDAPRDDFFVGELKKRSEGR